MICEKKEDLILPVLLQLAILGGKIYLDKQEAKKQADLIEAERMSVIALKNTFQDIKKVKFEKSGFDIKTGSYIVFVELMNRKDKSVSFSFSFWKEDEKIGSYILKDREVQMKGITDYEIEVEYSNGKKEVY